MQNLDNKLEINKLGNQGDGIAETPTGLVFVPFALPGEIVIPVKGSKPVEIEQIEVRSLLRIEPICQHFGACGGCQMQHMQHADYLTWKTAILLEAFEREAIDLTGKILKRTLHYSPASRRRAVLTGKLVDRKLVLGFSEKASHDLIDIAQCSIMTPGLFAALPDVRELIPCLAPIKGTLRISIIECDNGIELSVTAQVANSNQAVKAITTHPLSRKFNRLSLNGEIVFEALRPLLKCGIAQVSPPPDSFVQASALAENDMAKLVCDHLVKSKKVCDLFSGFGPFALRLAENSQVYAAETNAAALASLDRAWRETGGKLKALVTDKRDLYRRPLTVKELKPYDAVVMDPPRAGAEFQCRELAKSNIKRIAAVSCNPTSLARDIKILMGGGYRLVSLTPIDQFAFTPHLEAVALLEK